MKNKITNYKIIFLLIFFSCNKNQEEILLSDIDLDKIRNSYNEYSYKNSHKAEYIYDQNKLHRFDIWLNIKIVQTEDIIIMGLYVRNGSVTSATYVSKYHISPKK